MVYSTRKRTYANAFRSNGSRMQKRSRFARRKRFTRSKRTTDYTSLATRGTAVGFRGRKTSRRAYRRHVWNSTVFKDHWRSYQSVTDTADTVTPASLNTGTITFYNMYNHSGSPFWTTAGGAVEKDLSLGVPDFADVTLRGGKFEMTIANQSANDIKFKIWRFNTGNNPDIASGDYIPSPLNPQDQAWDPSVVPDFYTQVGKPFLAKEVTLEGGNSYTFVTRFKMQKIDQNAYQNTVASRSPFILVMGINVGNATANDYSIRRSYNLSFAGDAIAPGV